jgi:hypothetical protein
MALRRHDQTGGSTTRCGSYSDGCAARAIPRLQIIGDAQTPRARSGDDLPAIGMPIGCSTGTATTGSQ